MNTKNTIDGYYMGERKEVADYIIGNNCKVLDFGCGSAEFLSLLKKRNFETWGVEPVKEIADIATGKIDRILNETAESAMAYLPNNYFDYITFNDVLEHLEDPWNILRQSSVKLNKEGKLVASIPNVRFYTNLLNLLFRKDWKYENAGILDKTHLRFFTKKSMIRLFSDSGYTIEKVVGINGPRKIHKVCISFLFNVLTLGFFSDIKYPQFLIIAKPKK
ncbi:MAG: class I SAM-dependent methyltransferase [bacterium]